MSTSHKTPFELRFDIFNQAKDILTDQYHGERDDAISKYHSETDAGRNPDFPEPISYPTFSEIRDMAQNINMFVSDGKK